jgi:glycosyltransferase involved in cell wall biosynthesis
MACILKAPEGDKKGCVVFTTPERDHVIYKSDAARDQVTRLKEKYLIGLHHNWHDHAFNYDPLFDFSMAGDGDLIEVSGKPFPRVPIDACNFSPSAFQRPRAEPPFWDILYVARAVAFKGIPEFFAAVRKLYDEGHHYRVLFICSTPPVIELPGIPDLRAHFESLFTPEERKLFTLLTLDWDYPFPLDLETLSHFYSQSRIFVHPAPEERRSRVTAYAWCNQMPVVANEEVASILPLQYRKPPFLYSFDEPADLASAIIRALADDGRDNGAWKEVSEEFSTSHSALRLDAYLHEISKVHSTQLSSGAINPSRLDIRLGRHNGLASGDNRLPQSIQAFCERLLSSPDSELVDVLSSPDPEKEFSRRFELEHGAAVAAGTRPSEGAARSSEGNVQKRGKIDIKQILRKFRP